MICGGGVDNGAGRLGSGLEFAKTASALAHRLAARWSFMNLDGSAAI